MSARFLLDTHVVARWLTSDKKLSREQRSALDSAVRRTEPIALSAISLLEIAMLANAGVLLPSVAVYFEALRTNPLFQVLPLTYEIALEAASLAGRLRDPADCVIVGTARVHRLCLLTSDQRIVESTLASVIG